MNRADYPIEPEKVIAFLYDRHAYFEGYARGNPARFSDLMSGLGLGPERRNKFKQQLQDMARHDAVSADWRKFGFHHGYYPTGWQLTTAGAMAWRGRERP